MCLSLNTAYALASIFGRVCASCYEKGISKSMTASLQTDDRLESRSTKVRVRKSDFEDGFTLKNRCWTGLEIKSH